MSEEHRVGVVNRWHGTEEAGRLEPHTQIILKAL